MPASRERQFIPTKAREMQDRVFPGKTKELPLEIALLLTSLQNSSVSPEIGDSLVSNETSPLQPLLSSLEQEAQNIGEVTKERAAARMLLFKFGLPYLPGAEEVWFTLTEYLANAKEATEQAQLQLKQAIDQIRALLITQLIIDQKNQLKALKKREEEERRGIATLQKTSNDLAGEIQLIPLKDGAITQKKDQLADIKIQKREVENSIKLMSGWVSSLFTRFAQLEQLGSAQPVMV